MSEGRSIADLQRHMREYFHRQRQIQRRPIGDREYQQPVRIVQNPVSIDPPQQYPPLQEQRTPIQPQSQATYPHENQFNLAGFGLSIAVIGAVGGYMYLTSASLKVQIDTLIAASLGKLSVLTNSDTVMGIIVLGLVIAFVGIMTRKK